MTPNERKKFLDEGYKKLINEKLNTILPPIMWTGIINIDSKIKEDFKN